MACFKTANLAALAIGDAEWVDCLAPLAECSIVEKIKQAIATCCADAIIQGTINTNAELQALAKDIAVHELRHWMAGSL